MKPIENDNVKFENNAWIATCVCGKIVLFTTKNAALRMLNNKSCRNCKRDYRTVNSAEFNIYKRADGKWCSRCSGCDAEQAYTRIDHAKQSSLSDWQCKKCVAKAKGFSNNLPVGDMQRIYNKFKKSANSRKINWELSLNDISSIYNGKCAYTNWDISIKWSDCTASIDRIDSKIGYIPGNVQWVHAIVNMCKNKYDETIFIKMCIAIANNLKNKEESASNTIYISNN